MSRWVSGICKRRSGGKPGGDAGDDLDLDAGIAQGCELFAGAAEHERIAALEPHHGLAGARALDHQLLDLVLRDAVVALRLADRDQLDLAAGMFEHASAGEPVVENDIGGFQRAHRLQRQQLGIAGTGADEKHAALRGLCLHRGFDRLAHEAACFGVFTGKGRFARGAVEHAFPEFPPRAPSRKLLGDGIAEISGKTRQRIEPWMQLALEPGAQALGEHGRGTLGADGDRHLAAIDDGRHDEAAQSRLVRNIDGNAERAGDRRDAGILIVVAGGGNDQRPAADLIDAGTRGDQRDTAGALKLGKLGPELVGGDIDDLGALQAAAAS